jgi:2-polyprenyl-3-methyl-5-hydroxy-6-metoxy-1,4-benzoquinol methylase
MEPQRNHRAIQKVLSRINGYREMTTDLAWQEWGARDPYYAVLATPEFRAAALTPEAKQRFFESGEKQVDHILQMCRDHFDANFVPTRVLDFGCGVGRMLIPFAARAREVIGMDIAESMLGEARRNCEDRGCRNVTLVLSDDALAAARGQFDLVHSSLVLQHVEIARGRRLYTELVNRVQPGGCGAIHVTFGWDKHMTTFGVVPDIPPPSKLARLISTVRQTFGRTSPKSICEDPEMQMNFYNLNELMFILQRAGVGRVFTEIRNHGGVLGAVLIFQKASTND